MTMLRYYRIVVTFMQEYVGRGPVSKVVRFCNPKPAILEALLPHH